MPDSVASLPGAASPASEPKQQAEAATPFTPLGCLRQATISVPADAIIPQPACKAKASPGNRRR